MSGGVKVEKPRTRGKYKAVASTEDTAMQSPRATSAWQQTGFALPSGVVSRLDLSRLVREFEDFDNVLIESMVRKKAKASERSMPGLSPQLASFIELNPVDLQNAKSRSEYIVQLRALKNTAPIVHMTFAVVADSDSLQQLVAWLRQSIHAQTLIDVHLQPNLVAGVYVRTPNHVFDFSVRNALKEKRGELEAELGAFRG